MWRLLPLILLASCAVDEPRETASESRPAGYRIVNIVDVPLNPNPRSGADNGPTKGFQLRDTRGWIRESGAWNIRTAVTHRRLRCATYETGIQLGAGTGACADVRWLTNVDFGTRQTQCNSATVVHAGGGELAAMPDVFGASTCVRVVTRCEGAC